MIITSNYPVDKLSFLNIFLDKNSAERMIFKGKRGIIFNRTMNVDPGYKYIEKLYGGINCYMMSSNDFISNNFKK